MCGLEPNVVRFPFLGKGQKKLQQIKEQKEKREYLLFEVALLDQAAYLRVLGPPIRIRLFL
jgi:hypothetical protein